MPNGFYNVKHIFLTLSFIVLLRIKTIESIKYLSPGEVGKVLGLDRIPEIKTIRKKLGIIAKQKTTEQWNSQLSKDWMENSSADENLSGLLYVDGHVRVYHGKKTKLPKRYISRQKLCLRGMTDYWLNDAIGQPYFVISSPHNTGLLSALKTEIVPRLLKEVPNQPTKKELEINSELSRFSLIFDREGYSPEFFKKMWENYRISCYTYKKFPGVDWPEEQFIVQDVKLYNGEIVKMRLAEKTILLGKKVKIREIRKLTKSGHQTSIITTDFIPKTPVVAARMFARWSQENFFKYMMQHFGIDRLVEYGITPVDDTVKVINPEYRLLESQIRSVSQKRGKKISEFGKITLEFEENIQMQDLNIEKYMNKKALLQETIELFSNELEKLKTIRKNTDKYIAMSELPESEKYSSLINEKKHIMDTVKMIAYRAETAMATLIEPEISKRKETRSILQQIFATEIDMDPDDKNNQLTITLHSLSNEKTNKIAAKLCNFLNQTETVFPGTNMKVFYKMVS